MDLTEAMYAATENPPPTAIDVDAIVAGERRRARVLHGATGVTAGVTAAAALVAGVLILPGYLGGTPQGQSPPGAPVVASGSPRPCVTPSATGAVVVGGGTPRVPVAEPCGAAIGRLEETLTSVLRATLPGATLHNQRDGSALPAVVENDPHEHVGYAAGFTVRSGDRDGVLSVQVRAAEWTPAEFRAQMEQALCPSPPHPGMDCRFEERAGTVVFVLRYPQPDTQAAGIDVRAVRPDGTMIMVLTRAAGGGDASRLPLTEQQLIAIATAPELTLYP